MAQNVTSTTRLGLPLLAIVVGFFIPSWTATILLWIIALTALTFGLRRQIGALCENTPLETLLIFASLYVLGTAILPFALICLIFWGIFKLCTLLHAIAVRRKEGLKRFFIPLMLNLLIWILPLNYTLTQTPWISSVIFAADIILLGLTIFYAVKLVRKHKQAETYLTFNSLILLITVSAAIAGFVCPWVVSLNLCGIYLILWLGLTIFNAFIIALVAWITLFIGKTIFN